MYDALDSFIKLIKYSKSDKTQRLISEYIYQMKLENKTANYFWRASIQVSHIKEYYLHFQVILWLSPVCLLSFLIVFSPLC